MLVKTPEEIKKGLWCCHAQYSGIACSKCPYSNDGRDCGRNGVQIMKDALAYIQQLEASYQQVSKALCDKENATPDEILRLVSQVKAELEAVKREKDAAVVIIKRISGCNECAHADKRPTNCLPAPDDWCEDCEEDCVCKSCCDGNSCWQWRGVCPDTEVQDND